MEFTYHQADGFDLLQRWHGKNCALYCVSHFDVWENKHWHTQFAKWYTVKPLYITIQLAVRAWHFGKFTIYGGQLFSLHNNPSLPYMCIHSVTRIQTEGWAQVQAYHPLLSRLGGKQGLKKKKKACLHVQSAYLVRIMQLVLNLLVLLAWI